MFLEMVIWEFKKIIRNLLFSGALIVALGLIISNIIVEKGTQKDYDAIRQKTIDRIQERMSNTVDYEEYTGIISDDWINRYRLTDEQYIEFHKNHQVPEFQESWIQLWQDGFIISIVLLVALMGLFCSNIISKENRNNMNSLQWSSKVKRLNLYHSKFVAMMLALLLFLLIIIVFTIVVGSIILGPVNFTAPMQSIRVLSTATLQFTIIELLVRGIFYLILITLSFGCVYMFLSSFIRNATLTYIITLLLIGSMNVFLNELYLPYLIPGTYYINSWFPYYTYPANPSVTITLISMLIQSILLYGIGMLVYRRKEVK